TPVTWAVLGSVQYCNYMVANRESSEHGSLLVLKFPTTLMLNDRLYCKWTIAKIVVEIFDCLDNASKPTS
ncbi:382_t:CDS:2, partial [Racocetra persica]